MTMACFSDVGRIPDCRDTLQIFATTGARTAAARLTNHVGTGSSEQCLHGALNINFSASSCEHQKCSTDLPRCRSSVIAFLQVHDVPTYDRGGTARAIPSIP